jgi:NADH-quinone oxidoreductase subunit E
MCEDNKTAKSQFNIDLQPIVDRWKDKEGNLIMILHDVQHELGYVPRAISLELSRLLKMPLARIYEVLTFYNFFKIEPPGKHHISICLGTACYLKGAPNLLSEAERILNIKYGQTTPDGFFYLDLVRCVGCCGLAPVVVVDGKVHGKVTREQIAGLINDFNKEKEPA